MFIFVICIICFSKFTVRRVKISSIFEETRFEEFYFFIFPHIALLALVSVSHGRRAFLVVFFFIHFCFARGKDRWQDWTAAESILVRSLVRTQLPRSPFWMLDLHSLLYIHILIVGAFILYISSFKP